MGKNKQSIDYVLLATVGIILIIGLAVLWSASTSEAKQTFGSTNYFVIHQLTRGVLVGGVLLYILSKIDYHFYKKPALVAVAAGLLLLVLVKVPGIGFSANGATRWVDFGPILFQPSEFVKLALIVYLAAWSSSRLSNKEEGQSIVAPLVIILIIAVLILSQPDLGTVLSIVMVSAIMFFAAGVRIKTLATLGGVGTAIVGLLIWLEPYRVQRITTFLNPSADPLGIGYQINQALIAIGSGGLLGYGYGLSRQKHFYLPEVLNDSIFAVMAEELGFIRIIIVLALFAFLIYRSSGISLRAPDQFGRILAIGITALFGVNVIINVGAILALLPLTGIPLPFFSYGSSAMIVNLAAIGILLNISKQSRASQT